MTRNRIHRALRRAAKSTVATAVRLGADPSWFQYRAIETEPLESFCRTRRDDPRVRCQRLHEPNRAHNPLPLNVRSRETLPMDPDWWGYSFWDVPERQSGLTLLATLPDCRVVPRVDERGEFWVTVLNDNSRSLRIREMALRREHAAVLRHAPVVDLDSAVWFLERVYHNYSHWFTAHMPKLLLLRQLGLADEALLPAKRPKFIDDALRLFGFDPAAFRVFDPSRVLRVKRLTVLDTDRFRPELLQLVRQECPVSDAASPARRVFISRKGAERRRLLNEEQLWPLLEQRGFERIRMEDLTFNEQVRLMQETSILCAPHGAGLTNMMFCAPGTQVIELADLGFPNPNFYAVACAMKHGYWLVPAIGVGDTHPLEKDMRVEPEAVMAAVDAAIRRLPQKNEDEVLLRGRRDANI